MIAYKCPTCRSVLDNPSSMAGNEDQCPICGKTHTVPGVRNRLPVILAVSVGVGVAGIMAVVLFWVSHRGHPSHETRTVAVADKDNSESPTNTGTGGEQPPPRPDPGVRAVDPSGRIRTGQPSREVPSTLPSTPAAASVIPQDGQWMGEGKEVVARLSFTVGGKGRTISDLRVTARSADASKTTTTTWSLPDEFNIEKGTFSLDGSSLKLSVRFDGLNNAGVKMSVKTDGTMHPEESFSCAWVGLVSQGPTQPTAKAHATRVFTLAIAPDGKFLASGSFDSGEVKLWSLPTKKLVKVFRAYEEYGVQQLSFSADSKQLVSGGWRNDVKLWTIPECVLHKTLSTHCEALAISGQLLATGVQKSQSEIELWSLRDYSRILTLKGHGMGIRGLAASIDGKMLASASSDYTVRVWSLPGGDLLRKLVGHNQGVAAVAFSPNGEMLASGGHDYNVRLWSLKDGSLLKTLKGHTYGVVAVRIAPDGKTLVSAGWDGTLRIWSMPDGALQKTVVVNKGWVECLAASPDGKLVATGGSDGIILLWSLPDGKLLGHLADPAVK